MSEMDTAQELFGGSDAQGGARLSYGTVQTVDGGTCAVLVDGYETTATASLVGSASAGDRVAVASEAGRYVAFGDAGAAGISAEPPLAVSKGDDPTISLSYKDPLIVNGGALTADVVYSITAEDPLDVNRTTGDVVLALDTSQLGGSGGVSAVGAAAPVTSTGGTSPTIGLAVGGGLGVSDDKLVNAGVLDGKASGDIIDVSKEDGTLTIGTDRLESTLTTTWDKAAEAADDVDRLSEDIEDNANQIRNLDGIVEGLAKIVYAGTGGERHTIAGEILLDSTESTAEISIALPVFTINEYGVVVDYGTATYKICMEAPGLNVFQLSG